ncbi:MAG: hypothetical protein AAFR18_20310 [Cyanobacteria bacterium J06627_32]
MIRVSAAELKFLLKLLGCDGYRGAIATLSPSSKTSAAQRDRICRALGEKGLVTYHEQVARFTITPHGRTLLALENKNLLVTPDERSVLTACRGSTTPGQLSKITATARQSILLGMSSRGLVKISKTTIKDVWLTAAGKSFLLEEYSPAGAHPVATASMLGHYARFFRRELGTFAAHADGKAAVQHSQPNQMDGGQVSDAANDSSAQLTEVPAKPDRRAVVQYIQQLDEALGTGNRLPIFHLREKLQSTLPAEELDDMLKALYRNKRLQLSALLDEPEDALAYTPQQKETGILKDDSDHWFFVSLPPCSSTRFTR